MSTAASKILYKMHDTLVPVDDLFVPFLVTQSIRNRLYRCPVEVTQGMSLNGRAHASHVEGLRFNPCHLQDVVKASHELQTISKLDQATLNLPQMFQTLTVRTTQRLETNFFVLMWTSG